MVFRSRESGSSPLGLLVLLVLCSYRISQADAGSVAVLPEPPVPVIVAPNARTGCPYLKAGLKDWSVGSTWPGGSVPTDNSDVTLPENTRILISKTIPVNLGKITIPKTSELIFGEDQVNGIELKTKGIEVLGALTIGSETCRIQTPVTITLLGSRPANAVTSPPAPSYKGISVNGGTIHMHGKRYYQTWSRLAKTVKPGDKVLTLKRPVNWEAGQKIVLVTSSMHDSRSLHQNEELTVKSVSPQPGGGALVYVEEFIEHKHIANVYYQVEVGLLSRTIVVQGSADDSEPSDLDTKDCLFDKCSEWYWLRGVPQTCTTKETTGFGGHVMVHSGGKGYVEGIELYRMGQTNVLGRYPMHFHVLGDACPDCYFRDSSVHRSFYRCISIHGTNNLTVSENVAYDVIGYCYYLEDGVEEYNTLSFNLVAHVHTMGPEIATGCWGQTTPMYNQTDKLTLPADVTASGFYITNVHNYIVGNAASGGWSGFAFPSLPTPLGPHRYEVMRPSNAIGLKLNGNTVHSTGLWWDHAGGFYFGGDLYYLEGTDILQYNPGRSSQFGRAPCNINTCTKKPPYNDCPDWKCPENEQSWLRMTNSKAFLIGGVGLNSWSGRMELLNYESYDSRLAAESLSDSGFWINRMSVVCRTGESLGLPTGTKATSLEGSGFYWYDTGQSHIITNAEFSHCGYRSDSYNQYDKSVTRGCGADLFSGCSDKSTTFGFLTHSDQFNPEIMQGTKAITFKECGRRFRFTVVDVESVSGRGQNWVDVDGTVSGFGEPTLIGSGFNSVRSWWRVEDEVFVDQQAPLTFIKQNNGPERSIGHFTLSWDTTLHNRVGSSFCGNGNRLPCPAVGYVRHLGHKFSPALSGGVDNKGYPITANPDTVGPVGGFGWLLKLNQGAPRTLEISQVEMSPNSTLMLSIAYPKYTKVNITAISPYCWEWTGHFTCKEIFRKVGSVAQVRNSPGNVYHMSTTGVLTLRVIEFSKDFTGNPDWVLPTYDTPGRDATGLFALPRFERGGVLLPHQIYGSKIQIKAQCPGNGTYCQGTVVDYDPDVCQSGFKQVAYDTCCNKTKPNICKFADGSTTTRRNL